MFNCQWWWSMLDERKFGLRKDCKKVNFLSKMRTDRFLCQSPKISKQAVYHMILSQRRIGLKRIYGTLKISYERFHLFLHDNTPAHKSYITMNTIRDLRFEIFRTPILVSSSGFLGIFWKIVWKIISFNKVYRARRIFFCVAGSLL